MAEAKTINALSINLTDESFEGKKSNEYHLSILASENSFDFSILDTNTNKYLVLQSHAQLPCHSFKSVNCCIAHNKFSLIPNSLFDEEKKESLLGFNQDIKEGETIISNTLHNLEAKNLFTISKSFVAEIRKQFPNANFIHATTAFIEGLLVQNKNNSGKKVFTNFYSNYFEIVILDGRDLLFNNAFTYKTSEDIAYYILFVYEQLHLNTETIELVLSGAIEKKSKEHSLLYNYIRNVKFSSLPESFKYSYKFD